MKIFMDTDTFGLVYQGFIIGSSLQQNKTITQARLECKILDALDSISENAEGALPTGDPNRVFVSGTLSLNVEALEMLIKYMEAVPWNTKFVRRAVLLIDSLRDDLEKHKSS